MCRSACVQDASGLEQQRHEVARGRLRRTAAAGRAPVRPRRCRRRPTTPARTAIRAPWRTRRRSTGGRPPRLPCCRNATARARPSAPRACPRPRARGRRRSRPRPRAQPAPGIIPPAIGYVGSRLVATKRAPLRAASAARVRPVEVEVTVEADHHRVDRGRVDRRAGRAASSASTTPGPAQREHRAAPGNFDATSAAAACALVHTSSGSAGCRTRASRSHVIARPRRLELFVMNTTRQPTGAQLLRCRRPSPRSACRRARRHRRGRNTTTRVRVTARSLGLRRARVGSRRCRAASRSRAASARGRRSDRRARAGTARSRSARSRSPARDRARPGTRVSASSKRLDR